MEQKNRIRTNLVSASEFEKTECDKGKIQIEAVDSSFKDEPVGSQLSQSEDSSNEHKISKKNGNKRCKEYKKKVEEKSRRGGSTDMSDSDECSVSSNSEELDIKKRKNRKLYYIEKGNKQKFRTKKIDESDFNSISESSSRSSSVSNLLSDSNSENCEDSNLSDDSKSENSINDRSDDNNYSESENSDSNKRHDFLDKSSEYEVYRIRKKCIEYEKLIEKLIKQLKHLKKKQKSKESTKEKIRYELTKKKVLRKKKKLEYKLKNYQERISLIKNKNKKRHIKDKECKYNFEALEQKDYLNQNQSSMCENNYQHNFPGSLAGNIKMPYPVLNDGRDHKIILRILMNKQAHLNSMLEQTLDSLKNIENETNSHNDSEARKNRLKNLEENIKVQLTRLTRQIDFINYSLEVSKISYILEKLKEECQQKSNKKSLIEKVSHYNNKLRELNRKVEHLFNFMNDANQRFLKQQEGNKNQYTEEGKTYEKRDKKFVNCEDQPANIDKLPMSYNYYQGIQPPILKIENEKKKIEQKLPDTFNQSKQGTSLKTQNNLMPHTKFKKSTDVDDMPQNKTKQTVQNSAVTKFKIITPDSDPKEILAMLNAKYGHKKETTVKSETKANNIKDSPSDHHSLNRINNYKQQQMENKINQNISYIDRQNTFYSDNNKLIEKNLKNTNLPVSMLNSPIFMSTMTSMLQSMSQQGININAIINQLPSILSSFNNSNFNISNSNINKNQMNKNYSNNMIQNRHQGDFYNNRAQQADSALLPNPFEYEATLSDQNFAVESFCNYLSNTFHNIPEEFSSGMNTSQLNAMMLESGLMQDFNTYSNSSAGANQNNNKNYNNRKFDSKKKYFNKNKDCRPTDCDLNLGYSRRNNFQFRNTIKYRKN